MNVEAVLREILQDGGEAEDVVRAATPKSHPLHDHFEWDNRVAGHAYRLEQARRLIRGVVIPPDETRDYSLRAFVAVKKTEGQPAKYVPVEKAMADPVSRELVLRDMKREWLALQRRYGHMVEFADMIREAVEERVA